MIHDITDPPAERQKHQQDLEAFAQAHPDAKSPDHPARLGEQLDLGAAATAPPARRRGRPGKGIRAAFRQVSVFLPPDLLAQLDRLVEQEERRTHRAVTRPDILRAALAEYLQQRLAPEDAPHETLPAPGQLPLPPTSPSAPAPAGRPMKTSPRAATPRDPTGAPRLLADVFQLVRDYMRAHPGPHTRKDLMDALGLPRPLPDRLVTAGLLHRTAPGTYVLEGEVEEQ